MIPFIVFAPLLALFAAGYAVSRQAIGTLEPVTLAHRMPEEAEPARTRLGGLLRGIRKAFRQWRERARQDHGGTFSPRWSPYAPGMAMSDVPLNWRKDWEI